jgi:ABC-2 type transport system permease protein
MWVQLDSITPREDNLNRLARWLQLGAWLNGFLLLGSLIALAFLGVSSPDFARFFALNIPATASLWVLVLLVGNLGACLLMTIGILAQENWTWLVGISTIVINVLIGVSWLSVIALLTVIIMLVVMVQMLRDRKAFHTNPVMVKELRGRMRGIRSFAIISVFLALMGVFTVLLYLVALSQISGNTIIESGQLGRTLFRGIVGVELALIVLIMPALTAGAITGERERHTFDLLETTLLPVPSLLIGKMLSALGYIVLLIFAAIPLQSVAFLFGGVSQTEVILAVLCLGSTALLVGSLGIFLSTGTENTLTATVRVYILVLVMMIALPAISQIVFSSAFGSAINGVGVIDDNPLLETRTIYTDMILSGLNPITTALHTQQILVNQQDTLLFNIRLASNGQILTVLAPWVILLVSYSSLSAILLLLAIQRMKRDR